MPQNIFVYGSLMFPEVVKGLTGKQIEMKDAILKGYKRYKIYDTNGEVRNYPAIRKTEGEFVQGKILLDVDEDSLKVLDYFEDVGYKRIKEMVSINSNMIKVEVYVWPEESDKSKIELVGELKESWGSAEIEEFEEKHLAYFLGELIPDTLKEYKKAS